MITKLRHVITGVELIGISAILFIGLFIQFGYADDPFIVISTHFTECDSVLEAISDELSEINKLNVTDKLFLDITKEYPEFEYLMRTNSKGKIISKVSEGKVAARTYRYIGRQNWYKVILLTKRSNYGYLKSKTGYLLFWGKPIMIKGRRGSRFGGAVVTKINLQKSFNNIAKESNIKFEILFEKKSIFSNLDKEDSGPFFKKRIAVFGMPGMIVKYKKAGIKAVTMAEQKPAQEAVAAKGKTGKAEAKIGAKKLKKKGAAEKKPGKMVKGKDKTAKGKKEKGKSSGGAIIVLVLVILICAGLLTFCIIILKRAADKRRKLLEAIDKGEI